MIAYLQLTGRGVSALHLTTEAFFYANLFYNILKKKSNKFARLIKFYFLLRITIIKAQWKFSISAVFRTFSALIAPSFYKNK